MNCATFPIDNLQIHGIMFAVESQLAAFYARQGAIQPVSSAPQYPPLYQQQEVAAPVCNQPLFASLAPS